MKQSFSWEANRSPASQKILRIIRSPKVHHSIHKRAPPVPVLCQISSVPASPFYFLKIHVNIFLLPKCSKWPLFLRSPHQNPVCTTLVSNMCHKSKLNITKKGGKPIETSGVWWRRWYPRTPPSWLQIYPLSTPLIVSELAKSDGGQSCQQND